MHQVAIAAKETAVQVLYAGRWSGEKMNAAHNARVIREAIYWARFEGSRIIVNEKVVWSGVEFQAGSNIGDTLIDESWKKDGEKFVQFLNSLPSGTRVEIRSYRTLEGDKGVWNYVKAYTLL
jgi:hypothetical protein